MKSNHASFVASSTSGTFYTFFECLIDNAKLILVFKRFSRQAYKRFVEKYTDDTSFVPWLSTANCGEQILPYTHCYN